MLFVCFWGCSEFIEIYLVVVDLIADRVQVRNWHTRFSAVMWITNHAGALRKSDASTSKQRLRLTALVTFKCGGSNIAYNKYVGLLREKWFILIYHTQKLRAKIRAFTLHNYTQDIARIEPMRGKVDLHDLRLCRLCMTVR